MFALKKKMLEDMQLNGLKESTQTVYCDAIDDEVTLIVDKDGTSKCTGYTKYGKPDKETAKSVKVKSRQLGKLLRCEGLECQLWGNL